jgi:energy-converting hydrogenase Eha subunit C
LSVVPLIFTSGWASGINAYAVVVILGLFGRFGHDAQVPPTLERWDVLCVAGALFLCEFVADKIPYVDSLWDVVHTVVRPVMGGAIGALMTGHAHGSVAEAMAGALGGGGTALASHLIKAAIRMGVNTSPEPLSNIAVSLVENLLVAGLVSLVLLHPYLAAAIAAALLVAGSVLMVLLISRIRRFRRQRRERRMLRRAAKSARAEAI